MLVAHTGIHPSRCQFGARLLVYVSLLVLSSCGRRGPDILEIPVENGKTLREVVAAHGGTTGVLVYTPEACLVCSSSLPFWLARSREEGFNLVLLVAGEVSEQDRRILRVHRIPVAGLIADEAIPPDRLPAEYLVAGGKIVARAEGYEAIRRQRLWAQPVE